MNTSPAETSADVTNDCIRQLNSLDISTRAGAGGRCLKLADLGALVPFCTSTTPASADMTSHL